MNTDRILCNDLSKYLFCTTEIGMMGMLITQLHNDELARWLHNQFEINRAETSLNISFTIFLLLLIAVAKSIRPV